MSFDEEIEFISKNFHYFNVQYSDEIFTLDSITIDRIISNDNLKLSKEEELFNFILKLYIKSKEYSTLFSYVILMNLSRESFLNFNINFDVNDIYFSIWKNIQHLIEQGISNKLKTSYQKSHPDFLYSRYISYKYQHNIIQYLTEKYQGNIQTQNIISITSSCHGYNTYKSNFQVIL